MVLVTYHDSSLFSSAPYTHLLLITNTSDGSDQLPATSIPQPITAIPVSSPKHLAARADVGHALSGRQSRLQADGKLSAASCFREVCLSACLSPHTSNPLTAPAIHKAPHSSPDRTADVLIESCRSLNVRPHSIPFRKLRQASIQTTHTPPHT